MRKLAITCLTMGSLFLILSGCALQQSKILPSGMEAKTFLEKDKFFEACVETEEPGVTLLYDFESTRPIYFDVHYHNKQDQKIFLKRIDKTDGEKGEVISSEPSVYCLMLHNKGSRPVGYTGDFEEE